MTEIILQRNVLADGRVKFELIGRNLPKNFLGLATDVDFTSKFAEGDYQGMTLSPEMQKLADQNQLIDLAKAIPEEGKVVLGLTLKANHLVNLPDGVLATLAFNDQAIEIKGFSNQVMSIYADGRQDVKSDWLIHNETSAAPSTSLATLTAAPAPRQAAVIDTETATSSTVNPDDLVQTDLNQASLQQLKLAPAAAGAPEPGWLDNNWLFALLAGLLVLVAVALFINRQKSRTRDHLKARISPNLSPVQKADFA